MDWKGMVFFLGIRKAEPRINFRYGEDWIGGEWKGQDWNG
jgi:hypothetical protein